MVEPPVNYSFPEDQLVLPNQGDLTCSKKVDANFQVGIIMINRPDIWAITTDCWDTCLPRVHKGQRNVLDHMGGARMSSGM